MNKENFLRVYNKLSILIGFLLLMFTFFFTNAFPKEYSSLTETNVFMIRFVSFFEDVSVSNTPLFIFATLAILNILMLVRVGNTEDVEAKPLQSLVFYNMILSLMLTVGQVAFVLMIPESVNGAILNRVLFITFHQGVGTPVHIVFSSYLLALTYFVYNIVVASKTRLEVEDTEDEEFLYARTIEDFEEYEDENE